MDKGLVHIYTGDGKGKTTAAVGLAVRAAGQGLRVLFCQFLKSGTSGELAGLQQLGVQVQVAQTDKFIWQMTGDEKAACAAAHARLLGQVLAAAPAPDVLVLDEALGAVQSGMLAHGALLDAVRQKPPGTELVLTGRGADDALVALADYVTEMRLAKHPYQQGAAARQGIEY